MFHVVDRVSDSQNQGFSIGCVSPFGGSANGAKFQPPLQPLQAPLYQLPVGDLLLRQETPSQVKDNFHHNRLMYVEGCNHIVCFFFVGM